MSERDDGNTVEQAAREMVQQRGADAVTFLRGRAKLAEATSDELAAKCWRDIADVAEGCFVTRAGFWTLA